MQHVWCGSCEFGERDVCASIAASGQRHPNKDTRRIVTSSNTCIMIAITITITITVTIKYDNNNDNDDNNHNHDNDIYGYTCM